jgi:hypothetical protein
MGEQPEERKIGELCTLDIIDLPILKLADIGRLFEIKTSTIQMVQHSPFTGKEDPNLHLQAFVQLCQTFNMDGVTQDQMKARLFPFSLLRKALQWFYSQDQMTEVGSSNHQVLNMMKMLETQVGQLVGRLSANEGKLPGQHKGPEMAKAIQTHLGKETEDLERSVGARKPKPSAEMEEVTEIVTEDPEFEM